MCVGRGGGEWRLMSSSLAHVNFAGPTTEWCAQVQGLPGGAVHRQRHTGHPRRAQVGERRKAYCVPGAGGVETTHLLSTDLSASQIALSVP